MQLQWKPHPFSNPRKGERIPVYDDSGKLNYLLELAAWRTLPGSHNYYTYEIFNVSGFKLGTVKKSATALIRVVLDAPDRFSGRLRLHPFKSVKAMSEPHLTLDFNDWVIDGPADIRSFRAVDGAGRFIAQMKVDPQIAFLDIANPNDALLALMVSLGFMSIFDHPYEFIK